MSSAEFQPLACLGTEIDLVRRGYEPGPPKHVSLIEEADTHRGIATLLECENCSAGTIVFHDDDWNIIFSAKPPFGPTLLDCPYRQH